MGFSDLGADRFDSSRDRFFAFCRGIADHGSCQTASDGSEWSGDSRAEYCTRDTASCAMMS